MPKYKFADIAINMTKKRKPTDEDMETYIGLEHLDTGSLEVTRWGSKVPIKGDKLIMKKGDILFGKRNAYLKRAAIAPHDGLFSAHGMILRPNKEVISPKLFPFFICSDYFFDAAIRISVGSLSPTINWSTLKELEFTLPNMDEQEKLAELLWAANNAKETYKKLIYLTDELVKAQFTDMFGRIGFDDKGWGLTKLGECCMLNPRKPKEIDDDLVISFLAMPSVSEDGNVDLSVNRTYGEVKKGFTYFQERDVLFAKITPCMENGKGAVVEGLSNGMGMGSTEFHVLRTIKGVTNPYWIYVLTMFKEFRVNARKVMTGTGGQLRVPITYLQNYEISLPPIEMQNEFELFYKKLLQCHYSYHNQ